MDDCYTYFIDNNISYHGNILSQDDVFDALMSMDPYMGLNCHWIFDQYKEGHFLLSDADEVRRNLKIFNIERGRLPRGRRELYQYSYPEVLAIIASLSVPSDIETAYGKLSILHTYDDAQTLGSGTDWYISESSDAFDNYSLEGTFYVWDDYERGEKYLFQFETSIFVDSTDEQIDDELLQYFRNDHPVLSKLFEEKEEAIMTDPTPAARYAAEVLKGRWPQAERYIIENPGAAYNYAKDVLHRRWYEAEPVILSDSAAAKLYRLEFNI